MASSGIQGELSGGSISVRTALRLAFATWVVLLVIPFFFFLAVLWELGLRETTAIHTGPHTWFLSACAYLVIVVPAGFFWRDRLFKSYWSGHPIEPMKYLFGNLAMWAALEFGGIISLLGCLVERSLLPNLLPALIAFVFFMRLWPSGKAMVRSVGQAEDASVYEEPR
jgi:hypothetical protein